MKNPSNYNATLFTGADTHDIFNIGDKDPAYADVVGVKHVLCGFDDLPDGYLADYDALLNLGLQRDLNRCAAVVFRLALLPAPRYCSFTPWLFVGLGKSIDRKRPDSLEAYNALAKLAKKEHDEDQRPAIKNAIPVGEYDTIYLGYPMWWYTFPMIIYSLFDQYDFSGKTLIPFNTHMGSGDGGTYKTVKRLAPNATVLEGLPVEMTQAERGDAEQIAKWLRGIGQI